MHEWTGDERWADAWHESADELLRRRDEDGLWTIHLYGETYRGLGPAHGLVGNVLALRQRLPDAERAALERDTAAALARAAAVEDGLANWGEQALQWCSGAPGIVISAADYLDEEVLLAGAELIWQAGPHGDEKGYGICHGTAGNGYALLKAFERTGDERWLERARRFAVHALEQAERLAGTRGRRRYSLWTGDVGAALFAGDCLDATRALSGPRRSGELDRVPADGGRRSASAARVAPASARPPLVGREAGRTRRSSSTICRRSRAPIRPITTSCCSTDAPSACFRRTSSWTIRRTQR